MKQNAIELKQAPEVKRIVTAAFPGYRKLTAYLSAFHPMNVNSYWDGGSKDEYALVDLATGRRVNLPHTSHPYFDITRHGLAERNETALSTDHVGNITLKMLPENYALVAAGTFCGKPAVAHVYVNDANLTRFLPC